MSDQASLDELSYREASEFLMREAELLDNRQFAEWLALLTEDIYYNMPIRVTRDINEKSQDLSEGAWLSENRKSLEMRIKRITAKGSLSENPPSRTRHFVSNVRVERGSQENEIEVNSNLLLYRTRGDSTHYDLFSAERKDVLRRVNGSWKLARRDILLDQSVLGAQDLSVFL